MIATEYRLPIYALILVLYLLALYLIFLTLQRKADEKHWQAHNARADAMHERDALDSVRDAA